MDGKNIRNSQVEGIEEVVQFNQPKHWHNTDAIGKQQLDFF